jgi:hypothetical protein
VFFDRNELNQLLSLYSRKVIAGTWRDYAIDHTDTGARFSVFRHTLDLPLFSIEKRHTRKGTEFRIFRGRARVSTADSLSEALSLFRNDLKIVS